MHYFVSHNARLQLEHDLANNSSFMRGMIPAPSSLPTPCMLKVFPLPVCPYAKIVVLNPGPYTRERKYNGRSLLNFIGLWIRSYSNIKIIGHIANVIDSYGHIFCLQSFIFGIMETPFSNHVIML